MSHDLVRMVLIDNHLLVSESLASQLDKVPGFQVVATASSSEEGLHTALEHQPELVIMDIDVPGRGAFEIAQDISDRLPKTRILFLTGILSGIFLDRALRISSVRGYLLKEETFESLLISIRRVCDGEYCFSQEVLERLIYDPSEERYAVQEESLLCGLTSRQIEVLRHLASGESVKEVARVLHVSEKSVDSHKYRIMHKLGIHDRVGLARYAIREGLVLP